MLLDKNCSLFHDNLLREEFLIYLAVFVDSIWSNRNLVTHELSPLSLQEMNTKTASTASKHWSSQIAKSSKACSITSVNWINPPHQWHKVNTDCSFFDENAAASFVIRNYNGSILYAEATISLAVDALHAEIIAIKEACMFMNKALENIIF